MNLEKEDQKTWPLYTNKNIIDLLPKNATQIYLINYIFNLI